MNRKYAVSTSDKGRIRMLLDPAVRIGNRVWNRLEDETRRDGGSGGGGGGLPPGTGGPCPRSTFRRRAPRPRSPTSIAEAIPPRVPGKSEVQPGV